MKRNKQKDIEFIWQSVGYIIHLSCMIEQNVKLLISGEEFLKEFDEEEINILDLLKAKNKSNELLHKNTDEKKMLGKLIDQLEKYKLYKGSELIKDLRKASGIRGFYAHEFFKNDLKARHLETDPLYYKEQIQNDVSFLYELNEELTTLVSKYKELAKKA